MTVGGIVGVVKDIREVKERGETRVTIETGTSTGGGGAVAHHPGGQRVGPGNARAGMSLLTLHLLGSPVLRQRSAEVRCRR